MDTFRRRNTVKIDLLPFFKKKKKRKNNYYLLKNEYSKRKDLTANSFEFEYIFFPEEICMKNKKQKYPQTMSCLLQREGKYIIYRKCNNCS